MNKVVVIGTVAVLALAAAGCRPKEGTGSSSQASAPPKPVTPASVKPGEEATLFPLKVGTQWTYKVETRRVADGRETTGSGEVTLRVASATPIPGGVKATLDTIDREGKVAQSQEWQVTAKGIYQITAGQNSVPFSPPQPAILFPIDSNRTFSWKGTGVSPVGRGGAQEFQNTVTEAQEIDTDMGPFSAIPVESGGKFKTSDDSGKPLEGRTVSTTYWVPKVGIARFRQEIIAGQIRLLQVLVLKSFVEK
ncbi:MAG: hypothetical protein HZC36_15615 [Armatimonadetes bacterium]|nr:hypothetical protein [Armatimonadota bacterium]